jgi:hypothetical protein
MSTENCPLCDTVISSSATVCRGCGAEKKVKYDKSTFGLVKGYFAAIVAALFFGGLVGLFSNEVAGIITGVALGGLGAYLVNQYGARIEYWERNTGYTIGPVQHDIEHDREQEKPVAVVAAAVTPAPIITSKVDQPLTVNPDTRDCPYCAETIKAAAKLCRFCKSEVKPLLSKSSESVESDWVSLVEPAVQTPQIPVLTVQPTSKTPNSADFTWSVGGATISKPVKTVEPEVKPMTAERSPAVKPQRTESEALRNQNLWALVFFILVVLLGLMVVGSANSPPAKTVSSSVTPPASAKTTSITLANSDLYKDKVANGQPHGQGVLTAADGNHGQSESGRWKDGKPQPSEINYPNGAKYVGQIKYIAGHAVPNGEGTESYPSGGKFSGKFVDGKRHGYGTYTFKSGSTYSGEWANGKEPIRGEAIYPDGSTYSGDLANGQRRGNGVMTFKDGTKLTGQFGDNGQLNGKGTLETFNGNKYSGEYKNGEQHGEFTVNYSNGDRYVGELKEYKRNGKGTYFYAYGAQQSGIWKDGELQPTNQSTNGKKLSKDEQTSQSSSSQSADIQDRIKGFEDIKAKEQSLLDKNQKLLVTTQNLIKNLKANGGDQSRISELEGLSKNLVKMIDSAKTSIEQVNKDISSMQKEIEKSYASQLSSSQEAANQQAREQAQAKEKAALIKLLKELTNESEEDLKKETIQSLQNKIDKELADGSYAPQLSLKLN